MNRLNTLINQKGFAVLPVIFVFGLLASTTLGVGYLAKNGFLGDQTSIEIESLITGDELYIDQKKLNGAVIVHGVYTTLRTQEGGYIVTNLLEANLSKDQFTSEATLMMGNGEILHIGNQSVIRDYLLRDGSKTNAYVIDRAVTLLRLTDGSLLAIKLIEADVTNSRVEGLFSARTVESGHKIAGLIEATHLVKGVVTNQSVATPAVTKVMAELVAQEVLLRAQSTNDTVLAAQDEVDSENTDVFGTSIENINGVLLSTNFDKGVYTIHGDGPEPVLDETFVAQAVSQVLKQDPSLVSSQTVGITLSEGSITSNLIADLSIGGIDIAPDAIDGSKISNDSIKNEDVAGNAINSVKIEDNTITTSDLSSALTFSDGDYLDLSAITHDDAALQGLKLPNTSAAPVNPTSGEGHIAYDATNNRLLLYNGSSWGQINGVTLRSSGETTTTSSNSGLELDANNSLSLLQGCSNGEILKWNDTNDLWECSADSGGGGGSAAVQEGDTTITSSASTIDFLAADFSVTDSPAGEANIAIDYANSGIVRSNQSETISNAWVFSNGLTINSETVTDLSGTGISVSAGAITATLGTSISNSEIDNDTLDFDKVSDALVLDGATAITAGSALGLTIGNNVTFSATGTGSIVATDLNCTNCIGSTEIAVLTLGSDTDGDYVASFTAGDGLTGNASGEGSTPTIAVGAGTGIIVNADSIETTLGIAIDSSEVTDDTMTLDDLADSLTFDNNLTFVSNSATNDFKLVIDNASGGDVSTLFQVTTSGSGATVGTAIDLSDADVSTALALGSNDITVGGVTISSSEFALLDSGVTLGELTDSGTLTASTVDINGGAIDGTAIGASSRSTALFTTLGANGNVTLGDASTDTLIINAGSSGSGISFGDASFANCTALETVSGVLTCGTDDSGSGSALTVEEGNVAVDTTVTNIDFLGGDFDLSESPEDEINIQLAATLTSVTGVAGDFTVIGGEITIGSSQAFTDSSGSLTLTNVDALDATSETTIENSIDTLSNLSTLTIGGDTITDFVGTGLTLSGNTLTATLGTSVSNTELDNDTVDFDKVADALTLDAATTISATGATNLTIGNNVTLTTSGTGAIIATDLSCTNCIGPTEISDIALGTDTTGDYVASFTAGAGLTGDASGEGSTPTIAVGAGTGITVNANDIAINQATNFAWTGQQSFTTTVTATGSIGDFNLTLGDDTDADTVSAVNVDVTSAATSDADMVNAVRIGDLTSANATVQERAIFIGANWDEVLDLNGTLLSAVELGRLDGKDAALVDTNDAVGTAITGTGTLTSGATGAGFTLNFGASTLSGNITGANISGVDISDDTNLSATNGITLTGDQLTLSSTAGGDGLTYTSGVLAVGAGTGITVAADSISATLGTSIANSEIDDDTITLAKVADSLTLDANLTVVSDNASNDYGLVVDNSSTGDVTAGITFTTTGSGATWGVAVDLSDADITTALALGANDVTVGGVTLSSTELSRLDGKDANLLDITDAVNTAIVGTGALNSGSITSGFGSIDVGNDAITTTGTVTAGTLSVNSESFTDLTGNGLTISSGALTLASSTAGDGLTYTTGVLAVGAGTGISVSADSISATLGTSISNSELDSDTVDFDKISDSSALDADWAIAMDAAEEITFNKTFTNNTSENGLVLNLTASDTGASTTAQYGLYIDNLASTEGADALITLDNSDTDDAVGAAIKIIDAGGTFTNVLDIAGTLLSATELGRLDGKDANLVDVNDAVATAITGTGTLTAGATGSGFTLNFGSSTLSGNITGANISGIDISDDTNLTATSGITLTGDQLTATLGTAIEAGELTTQGTATDEYCLTYEAGGGALLAWQSCNAGGGVGTIEENNSAAVSSAVTIDFLGSDFIVTDAGSGEADISIDYANSGITRVGQAETITGGWTFSTAATTFTTAIDVNTASTIAGLTIDGNSNLTVSNGSIDGAISLSSTTSDNALQIALTNGTSSGTQNVAYLDNAASSGTTESILVIDNSDTDTAVTSGIEFIDAGGGFTNLFNVNGTGISSTEFTRLDGKDAALVDTNDAVGTAITGTGTLTSGATGAGFTLNFGTSTLSGNITGANISGIDISDDTNLSATNGITLTGDQLTLASSTAGDGLTYSSGILAVGAGTGLIVSADSISLDFSASLSGDHGLSANEAKFGANGIIFEGTSADNFETYITFANPTTDRTITFPNNTGTVSLLGMTIESSEITDDTIVNADINSAAAIDLSKLASGTSGQIIVANTSGVPTYVALSSDATISDTGALTIAANAVALGNDTTGNYVTAISNGTGITGANGGSEGASLTLAVDQSTAFAWTGQQSWTTTVTDTGSVADINVTIGNDSDADTVAGINIDATSVNTGDADTLRGIDIANLTGQNGSVSEQALKIGTGWDSALVVGNNTILSGAGVLQSIALQGTYSQALTLSSTSNAITAGTLTINSDAFTDLTGDGLAISSGALTLASTTAGNGLTYTTGVLAVGAGTGISVAADSISATLGTSIANAELDDDTVTLTKVADSLTFDASLTLVSDNATNDYNLTLDNSSTGDVATGISFTTSGTGATWGVAVDLSDADISTALALGANDVTVGGATIASTEFARLDGKDANLLDVNDAVTTAITGTGTLTSGATGAGFTLNFGTSTLSGNITGSNISGVDISDDTNLSATDGITLTGDQLTATLGIAIEAGELTTQGTATDEYCLTYETGGGALLAWQSCNAGGGISTIEENNSTTVSSATILDFLGADFTVTDAGSGEADIAIDYANSEITRNNVSETIVNDWTFDLAEAEDVAVSWAVSGTQAGQALNISATNSSSSGNQYGISVSNAASSGTTEALVLLNNADSDTVVTSAIEVQNTARFTNILLLGSTGLDATELGRLDGKDAALVDTNDAVGTAITGTGTLTSGSTGSGFTLNFGTSTLSGNVTGANISGVDISDDTNLSATNGITLTGDQLTLASTTAGDGLTYATGVLAVGAGTGISVAADSISATLGTSIANGEIDDDTITLAKVADSLTFDASLTLVSDNATNDYNLVIDNSSAGDVATGISFTTSGTGATWGTAVDLSDADIAIALALGSNDVTVGGATISSTEFARLDNKDAALVDTNDAVSTAITGTGTLTSGATGSGFTINFGTSTLSGNVTGTNISGVDISDDTNLSATDGITLTGDQLTLAATTAGNGLTYTSGVLAVGAGTGISVAADSISATLGTSIANSELDDNTIDFDKITDSSALDTDWAIAAGAGEDITVNKTFTNNTGENGLVLNLTASDTGSGTTAQYGLYIDNAASTEGADALIVLDNSDTDDSVGAAIRIIDAGGTFTSILDIAGVLLSGTELGRLDGKDANLLDVNDAVTTAITGTGTLTSGATGSGFTINFGTSTLSGNVTGANISGVDISDDTNLTATSGITLTGDQLTATLGTAIEAGELTTQGTATDEYCLTYEDGGGALLAWQSCNSGGGVSTIEENNSTVVSSATILDFLGADFTVTDAGSGEADIAIDYANSEITRNNVSETIVNDWTFDLAEAEDLAINWAVSGTQAGQGQLVAITNSSSSGNQYGISVSNAASTGTTEALVLLNNADSDTVVTSAIEVQNTARFTNILLLGSTGLDATELGRLDGKDAALVDTNDAVGTAITGTGTLTSGATGAGFTLNFATSTLSGNITGSNISGVDISDDTNLTATNGITLTGDQLTLSSTTAGDGLTYGTGVLAVGAGTGISVAADSVSVNQSTAFAWTGQQSFTTTVTATGSIQDINLTLGDDGDTDTVAAVNVDVTSAATSDADVVNAIRIGDLTSANGTVLERAIFIGANWDEVLDLNGTLISATELGRLDGKDANLLDVNDAVTTAITGTGTLTAGATGSGFTLNFGSSTLSGNVTGANISGVDVSDDTNLTATNGITLTGDQLTLASTTAGDGLTYTTGVLAVGAGTGISISADAISVTLGTAIEAGELTTQGTATDEYCLTYEDGGGALLAWQSCGGGGGTLQQAYDADADGSDATILTNSTDGSVIIQTVAGTQFVVDANAAPTVDLMSIDGTGQATVTDGVDGLSITLVQGTDSGADTNSGLTINLTAGNEAGNILRGITISDISGGASSTEVGLYIGTGYDRDLEFADSSPVIRAADGATLAYTDGTNTLVQIKDQGTYAFLNLAPKTNAGDPASCAVGDVYINSNDATIKACTGTDSWEALDGGSGGGTKIVTLHPEYPGATLTANGSATINGTMTSDVTGSADGWKNYYEWNSSQTSLQDYTVAVRFKLPNDFSSWATSNAIVVNLVTESTSNTNNKVDIDVRNEDDTPGTTVYTTSANVSGVAATWTTVVIDDSNIDDGSGPDWDAAGEDGVLLLKLYSKDSNYARIGDIVLTYTAQ